MGRALIFAHFRTVRWGNVFQSCERPYGWTLGAPRCFVGKSARHKPRCDWESRKGQLVRLENQEKPLSYAVWDPYRKPTQVNWVSSLRRAGKRSLRNSASWPRTFARRGAPSDRKSVV